MFLWNDDSLSMEHGTEHDDVVDLYHIWDEQNPWFFPAHSSGGEVELVEGFLYSQETGWNRYLSPLDDDKPMLVMVGSSGGSSTWVMANAIQRLCLVGQTNTNDRGELNHMVDTWVRNGGNYHELRISECSLSSECYALA